MIIDAHHHLWKFDPVDYGWMDDSMSVLKKDYLPAELEHLLPGAGVTGTVVVQARQNLEETRWLLELAEKHSFILGVVGWVDLGSEKLDEQLDEFTANSKLVGVRHVVHDEPDDDFMLRPEFVKGIDNLKQYNLSYDLLLFPKHLSRAAELAGMFPDQKFVLDHISKPFIKDGILDPWEEDIQSLAKQQNVWCKISGMVTEADMKNWKYEDFIPYLNVVSGAFGTERLMLGSDWPVCRLAAEYTEVIEIGKSYFAGYNEYEKQKIYSLNAAGFYNLKI